MAIEKIREVMKRGKMPIVVGGTNYYIESLLFLDPEAATLNIPKLLTESDHFQKFFTNFFDTICKRIGIESEESMLEILSWFKTAIEKGKKELVEEKCKGKDEIL